MTRKAALVVTALLTVFVLVTMLGVMTRLTAADASANSPSGALAQAAPQGAQVAPIAQSSTAPVVDAQLAQQREQIYRQRLDEANAQIQKANAQIQKANEQLQQLQAQNTQLLQREQTYQQRLQEANNRLTQPGGQDLAAQQTTRVNPQPANQQRLSPERAAAIAAQYMDGNVRGVQLANAGGSAVYDVKIGSGDVGVDPYNGNIVFIRDGRSFVRNPEANESRRKSHDRDDD